MTGNGSSTRTAPGGERVSIRLTAALAAAVVFAVLAIRALGGLEFLELAAYDQFLRLRSGHLESAPTTAVIAIDDAELTRAGWPYPDGELNKVITAAIKSGAAAVALDVYRGTPVEPGSKELGETFARAANVIGIFKFGAHGEQSTKAPPAISSPHRTGFADMVTDRGDSFVRRGLFYLSDTQGTSTSLAAQAARIRLAGEKIRPQPAPDNAAHLKLGVAVHRPLDRNFGGYRNMDNRGYQFLMDFRRSPAEIPTVKASELVKDGATADALKGRIAFMGVTSQSVKDFFSAPLHGDAEQRQIYGVYLHAMVADQIIRMAKGETGTARSLSDSMTAVLCLILAVAAAFLVRARDGFAEHAGLTAVLIAAISIACFTAFSQDWWLPLIPFALCTFLSAMVLVGAKEIAERRRRAALAGLLANQVSPAIARDLWENRDVILDGGRPKPVRLTATVLFVDLEGSTAAADELPPEELVEWVSLFLEEMASAVVQHDGVIEKFTGDGLMAVFGVPVPRLNDDETRRDVMRAVDCSIDMAARTAKLNARAAQGEFPHSRCRVGIHTGPLSAGNVGTRLRMQYTVIGQAANLAARLEAYGKDDPVLTRDENGSLIDCRVLVSGAVADQLDGRYALKAMGKAELRGAEEALDIYRLSTEPAERAVPGEPA
ncbi:MAG: adenylate/guanylate cyclase domain-containing protein [Pseudomonadota bacterium]